MASRSWAQPDEGMAPHELADAGVAAKVTPSEDVAEQPKSSRVATPKAAGDRDGFVLAEKPVFRCEAVMGDADFPCRTGAQVSHPVSIRSPRGADHDLAVVGVLREDHRHRVVRLPTLATDVNEHEEGSAERPAPPA